MTAATFLQRIESGKANHRIRKSDGLESLVSVWKHDGSYVVTWEECPAGGQYDESGYTRDEVHRFGSVEELMAFLAEDGLAVEEFGP